MITSNARTKLKRAVHKKSKLGCWSCRRRRIKCDETRPICVNCSKAGYDCEYHINLHASIQETPQLLLPKAPQKLQIPRAYSSGGQLVEAEIENQYIEHFQRKSLSGFQGIMDWSIWNRLVLQLTHCEPFVRESVVAIGALIRSLESENSSTSTSHDGSPSEIATMHKQFALHRYGRAVKIMQAALKGTKPREILVACLLIFCFETLLHNRNNALTHAITGHNILQDWLTKNHRSTLLDRGLRSPAPVTIDDELVDAFEHLDLQISTLYDVRSVKLHKTIIQEGRYVIEHMPSIFSTLNDAQRHLTFVMKQSHHFCVISCQSTVPASLAADFVMIPPGPLDVTIGVSTNSTSFVVSDTLRQEMEPYIKDVLRWLQAFEPLFQRTRLVEEPGSKDHATSALLKMHGISTKILLEGVLITEEILYDKFLPDFKEMLDLINSVVVAHQRNAAEQKAFGPGGFTLGLGITAPLGLLCSRCRDRTLRRRGVGILRSWHAEGCWDPSEIAAVVQFLIEVEEEDCPDGIIPEASRAVLTRLCEAPDLDNSRQQALIQCVKRHGGSDGGPVWKEKMIYWSSA